MTKDVVTLSLVCKCVRKVKDYMRVYRVVGLDKSTSSADTDQHVRMYKAHHCVLDNDLCFITGDEGDESGALVPVVVMSTETNTTVTETTTVAVTTTLVSVKIEPSTRSRGGRKR